ncbi:MAG: tRNA (guanosine(37)-N1)-methyltransferase TrmD [Victivallales bacterium]|nr:tRNA (guanosine(37)-N1)-methyltransferase TrmD [Victivallales bacterium]MBR6057548.1 tRNA (guanosine(37)-N1)-methyltransferase TrmD [Victivallales bacterium]
MRFDIVSLFPEICEASLGESIIGRAHRAGLVEIHSVDLRSYAHDKRGTVDDTPYGGGAGMVLRPEPLFECVEDLRTSESHVVLMTPQGRRFTQADAVRLSGYQHVIIVCGHYEGVDERARQALFDEELSIGDFVLTNGAIAAVIVVDSVARLLPGVLGCDESSVEESFGGGSHLLEYPQYTRPPEYRGMPVPDVLLSGDHEQIKHWRLEQRYVRTSGRRPDLLGQGEQEYR